MAGAEVLVHVLPGHGGVRRAAQRHDLPEKHTERPPVVIEIVIICMEQIFILFYSYFYDILVNINYSYIIISA